MMLEKILNNMNGILDDSDYVVSPNTITFDRQKLQKYNVFPYPYIPYDDRIYPQTTGQLMITSFIDEYTQSCFKERDGGYVLEHEIAGAQKDSIELSVETQKQKRYLNIACKQKQKKDKSTCVLLLPEDIDVKSFSATYEDGLLVVRVNKKLEKSIKIEVKLNVCNAPCK
jgi:HSP20 family molecular chaperone IbpA